MKWLIFLAAIVLGAAVTWLLTVRRVTRQATSSSAAGGDVEADRMVPEQSTTERPTMERPAVEGPAAEGTLADDAAAFGGAATHESSSQMGWDRTSQDEDALLHHDPRARELEVTDVLPIAGATPNGDVAGVAAPRADTGQPPAPGDEEPTAEALGPEDGPRH